LPIPTKYPPLPLSAEQQRRRIESFDTADLKDAKALLDELSA
jgi:hypothetical protein